MVRQVKEGPVRDTDETRTTEEAQERMDDDGAPSTTPPEARRSLRRIAARINRTVPAVRLSVLWYELDHLRH